MTNDCTFCTKFGRDADMIESLISDRILFESPNFVVVPTLGALTEGWLLIVPRTHYICFGAVNETLFAEFYRLKSEVQRCLEDCYGSLAMFEHGPAHSKEPLGCSVDHAHVHIVPTEYDLLDEVKNVFSQDLQWHPVEGIIELTTVHKNGLPYVYLEQPLGIGRFGTHPKFDSQIFRKAIARSIDRPERFDWRRFPELGTVASTVETIERWISERGNLASGSLSVAA